MVVPLSYLRAAFRLPSLLVEILHVTPGHRYAEWPEHVRDADRVAVGGYYVWQAVVNLCVRALRPRVAAQLRVFDLRVKGYAHR